MNNINNAITKLPPPKYLNLEYFFAKIIYLAKQLFLLIIYLIKLIGGFMVYHFALIFSLILVIAGAVILYKLFKLKQKQKIASYVKFSEEEKTPKDRFGRWDAVKKKIGSSNPEDWKMAIIEADTIFEDIFRHHRSLLVSLAVC